MLSNKSKIVIDLQVNEPILEELFVMDIQREQRSKDPRHCTGGVALQAIAPHCTDSCRI